MMVCEGALMKLRTRLSITFLTIIILPLLLTVLSFMGLGIYITNQQLDYGMRDDYSTISDPIQAFGETTEETYKELLSQATENQYRLEDIDYLQKINVQVSKKASYIIVRKDGEIYYSGNPEAADLIFNRLPAYGTINPQNDSGFYFNDLQKFVKQVDFTFEDGSQGSVFIVTKVKGEVYKNLLADMLIAIAIILVLTSFMLTKWISKGVFEPIGKLNSAMKHIKNGNFDYMLPTDNSGEIGELYHNYEDMRLRLKESTDEKFEHENQNRELIFPMI